MYDVTFCFIVNKNLAKESIWREWFDRLSQLGLKIRVVTHFSCGACGTAISPWLSETIIPAAYLQPTAEGFLAQAMLSLFTYVHDAVHAVLSEHAAWYCVLSDSCVPYISAEKFIENFQLYKDKTFLNYAKPWWIPRPHTKDRANLHCLPAELHLTHPMWCILCQEDLSSILTVAQQEPALLKLVFNGVLAQESWLAIFLKLGNNFKNVIKQMTTFDDWRRSPNGSNPYTFTTWSAADKKAVGQGQGQGQGQYMFLRKVDSSFPEAVLREFINPEHSYGNL